MFCVLLLSLSGCAIGKKKERICLVFAYTPFNHMTGSVELSMPPVTYISCDSKETQQELFKPK